MSLIELFNQSKKPKSSHDPTGTIKLRRAFRASAQLQLRKLRALLRIAVIDHDILGLGTPENGLHLARPADRLKAFSSWFEYEASLALTSPWYYDYIAKALASGEIRAAGEVNAVMAYSSAAVEHIYQLANAELKGIAAALTQKVIREAADQLRSRPQTAFRALMDCFDNINQRLLSFADSLTVKSHVTAKLEVYRTAGVNSVGIIPEIPNSRNARSQGRKDGAISRTGIHDAPLVRILTAGDDDVCDECDAYAEDGPYDLDDVEIPLHPNCRCSVVPDDDRRYARDPTFDAISDNWNDLTVDAFDPGQERGPGGQWESEGGTLRHEPPRTIRGHMEEFNRLAKEARGLGKRVRTLTNLRVSNEEADRRVAMLRQRVERARGGPNVSHEMATRIQREENERSARAAARVAAYARQSETTPASASSYRTVEQRIMGAVGVNDPVHLASGAPDLAVRRGAITPAEAGLYRRSRNWPEPETQIHPNISLLQQRALTASGWTPEQMRSIGETWTPEQIANLSGSNERASILEHPVPPPDLKYKREDFVRAGISVPNTVTEERSFLGLWDKNINMSPKEFQESFTGGLNTKLRLKTDGDTLLVSGDILDDDNDVIGNFDRRLQFGQGNAYSAYFVVNQGERGKDYGKLLLAGNVATYQKLGLKSLKVSANIDVGGYAWARYGYTPTAQSWGLLKMSLKAHLQSPTSSVWSSGSKPSGFPDPTSLRQLKNAVNSDDPKSIWDIADSKYGKAMLLGKSWSGELKFNDEDAMQRFGAYVKGNKNAGGTSSAGGEKPKPQQSMI